VKAKLTPVLMVVGIFAFAGVAFAHHGSASYSVQPTTLKDVTVTKVNWGNPHTLLLFDAKDDKGNVQHWVAEANAASAINSTGWTKTAIKPGDLLTVVLYPAKNGQPVGRVGKVVLADGREFGDGSLIGDRPSVCDQDFTTGGNEAVACRPGGRITNNLEKK
jgi:hypothetical protein